LAEILPALIAFRIAGLPRPTASAACLSEYKTVSYRSPVIGRKR
jgi:hypothetical protein